LPVLILAIRYGGCYIDVISFAKDWFVMLCCHRLCALADGLRYGDSEVLYKKLFVR